MKTERMKWLRLEFQPGAPIPSLYLIFHTHYAMYVYLQAQGYVLNVYQPMNFARATEGGEVYIQTDHQGFFESCLKNYARDFTISGLAPNFEPSCSFEPMFHDAYQLTANAS